MINDQNLFANSRKLENTYSRLKLNRSKLIIQLLKQYIMQINTPQEYPQLEKLITELQEIKQKHETEIQNLKDKESEIKKLKVDHLEEVREYKENIQNFKNEIKQLRAKIENKNEERYLKENDMEIKLLKQENEHLMKLNEKLLEEKEKHKNMNYDNKILEMYNQLNLKVDEIKMELSSKKDEILENIRKLIEMKGFSGSTDTIKDNTINLLKESLKIKDKLLNHKKKEEVNEEVSEDILESELVYDIEKTSKKKDTSARINKKKRDKLESKRDETKYTGRANTKVEKTPVTTAISKKDTNTLDYIVKNSSKQEAKKTNPLSGNASFFANLSFADTSPIFKKFDKR